MGGYAVWYKALVCGGVPAENDSLYLLHTCFNPMPKLCLDAALENPYIY